MRYLFGMDSVFLKTRFALIPVSDLFIIRHYGIMNIIETCPGKLHDEKLGLILKRPVVTVPFNSQ